MFVACCQSKVEYRMAVHNVANRNYVYYFQTILPLLHKKWDGTAFEKETMYRKSFTLKPKIMTYTRFGNKPFEKNFNNLVDELFTEIPVFFKSNFNGNRNGFAPVNIVENDTSYFLELFAPGFNKSDFKVSLDEGILNISGENKADQKNETLKTIRKEFGVRSFKRSFTLDEKIDATNIGASYINGVLRLNLPKKETVKGSAKEIIID
jgi:HSP20 family protein